MIKHAIVAGLLFLFVGEAFAADPLVYSRCKRTTESFTLTRTVTIGGSPVSRTRTFPDVSLRDKIMDVTVPFYDDISAPCDLVTRSAAGVETVIHDCSTTGSTVGQPTCAALDPVVSFDGTTIYYTLAKGTLYNFVMSINDRVLDGAAVSAASNETLPNKRLAVQGSHIRKWVNGVGTSDVTPYVVGLWDTAPVEMANGRIGFTTSEGSKFSTLVFRAQTIKKNLRFASVDPDGKNRQILNHNSVTQDQHPIALSDGWVAVSSWQTGMGIPFEHNNGTGGMFTTLENLFKVHNRRPDGSANTPILGQHQTTTGQTSAGKNFVALHFFGQLPNTDIVTADYYRGNNFGLGAIIGFRKEGGVKEGRGPDTVGLDPDDVYLPTIAYTIAPWAITQDTTAVVNTNFPTDQTVTHPSYTSPMPVTGKTGFPTGLPNGDVLMSYGAGLCSTIIAASHLTALGATTQQIIDEFVTAGGQGTGMNNIRYTGELMAAQGMGSDIPGCDLDLFSMPSAKFGTSTTPKDLVPVVTSRDWHYIQARYFGPYIDLHGIAAPPNIVTPEFTMSETPFGRIGWASITDREIMPVEGITVIDENLRAFHAQGTQTIDNLTDDQICGIRVIVSHPNDASNMVNKMVSIAGERQSVLWERYSKNYSGGSPILDINGNPDTSGLIELPADTPFMMHGIDCTGMPLSIDQQWLSVRPKELRTCNGCHLHSRDPLLTWPQSYAAAQNNPELAGRGTVQLLTGETTPGTPQYTNITSSYGKTYEYVHDIIPIFQSRCNSCHSAGSAGGPGGGLKLDEYALAHNNLTSSTVYSTYAALAWDRDQLVPSVQVATTAGTRFNRPYLSKYVVAFNPLRSLLYWKAAGQRTDNRLDTDYPNDIDYGAAHPATGITAAELGTLGRWIATGMLYEIDGSGIQDKTDPVLTIGATVIDNAGNPEISQLHIGTVDATSGINTASLTVQINGGANIAPAANANGVVTINLGTNITASTDVITATVSDASANSTTIARTAEFFMGAATAALAVSACADATIKEGETYTCLVVVTDGSPPYNYVINWDDGAANDTGQIAGNNLNISRVVPDGPATQTVNISITDAATTNVQDNIVLTVLNVPTTGSITVSGAGTVGVPYVLNVSIIDPGQDTPVITVDWGDGTVNNLTSHTYAAPGNYTVRFNAVDEDGISVAQRHVVTIQ